MNFKIINVQSYNEIYNHISNWEELFRILKLPISYSPKWLLAWMDSYLDGNIKIDITFVYKEAKLVAVIPLMVRKIKEKHVLKFLTDSCSDYLGFIFLPELQTEISKILDNQLNRIEYTHYDFINIHEYDKNLDVLISSLSSLGHKITIKNTDKSLSINLNDQFKQEFSNIKIKKDFRTKFRDFEKLENVSFKVVNLLNKKLFEEIYKIHIGKWTANKVFPQFSDEKRKKFVESISKNFIPTKNL